MQGKLPERWLGNAIQKATEFYNLFEAIMKAYKLNHVIINIQWLDS